MPSVKEAEQAMRAAVDATRREFSTVRTGKATPALLDTVKVDAYGTQMPLNQVATVEETEDARRISREDSRRFSTVQANVRGRDMGRFVEEAQAAVAAQMTVPSGYTIQWGGQFEHLIDARRRLTLVVPLALALILGLLYFTYRNVVDALRVSLVFDLTDRETSGLQLGHQLSPAGLKLFAANVKLLLRLGAFGLPTLTFLFKPLSFPLKLALAGLQLFAADTKLLVRLGASEARQCARILVPTAGGPNAEVALRLGERLARGDVRVRAGALGPKDGEAAELHDQDGDEQEGDADGNRRQDGATRRAGLVDQR